MQTETLLFTYKKNIPSKQEEAQRKYMLRYFYKKTELEATPNKSHKLLLQKHISFQCCIQSVSRLRKIYKSVFWASLRTTRWEDLFLPPFVALVLQAKLQVKLRILSNPALVAVPLVSAHCTPLSHLVFGQSVYLACLLAAPTYYIRTYIIKR